MRGLALCVMVLIACGDGARNTPIDAAIDAPPDARVLPAGSECVSSADCVSDPAKTLCCLELSPGGAAAPTYCAAPSAPHINCGESPCDPASRAPCMTVDGKAGTCQFASFGPIRRQYWVCRAS